MRGFIQLSMLSSLFGLLTYKLLQQMIARHFSSRRRGGALLAITGGVAAAENQTPSDVPLELQQQQQQLVRINAPALTAQQSFENDTPELRQRQQRFTVRQRQQRALQDFFRDTGGKVTDLRVVRSAMFLSDEIDRAVRGLDQENQYVGWRPYNRFYAQGTEELFTNIPTGRSPLVMAAPKPTTESSSGGSGGGGGGGKSSELKRVSDISPVLPIQYQAVRQSHLKQVGRVVSEIENSERRRLAQTSMRTRMASSRSGGTTNGLNELN